MTKDRVYVFNKGYKDKAVGVMPAVFLHGAPSGARFQRGIEKLAILREFMWDNRDEVKTKAQKITGDKILHTNLGLYIMNGPCVSIRKGKAKIGRPRA